MYQNVTFVSCKYCNCRCIKKGIRNGNQSYQCTSCKKYQKLSYRYNSYGISDELIVRCVKEGLGIRGISRLLRITTNTVIRRIRSIARRINKPPIKLRGIFEVDEMFTFVGEKKRRTCITIAIDRKSGHPIDYYVGPRSKRSLRMVTNTLLVGKAEKIYTDRLGLYRELIPTYIHQTDQYGTNKVERFNLTLRTHLKRLNRRSICFSKSLSMLNCCLAVYFWG